MTETESKTASAMTDQETQRPADAEPKSEEAAHEEAIEQHAGRSSDIARLEAEKADLTDRLLRTAAELDNLRRRSEREIADARKYSMARFAGDMLVVGDNLKRALEALPAEQRASGDAALKALLDGVEMTAREMDRLLVKNGVVPIAAKGERFDPNRHQAMFEVPDPSVPAGTVVQVVQEGYMIGDRVLRAALVGVAKDGPKPGTEAEAKADSSA